MQDNCHLDDKQCSNLPEFTPVYLLYGNRVDSDGKPTLKASQDAP